MEEAITVDERVAETTTPSRLDRRTFCDRQETGGMEKLLGYRERHIVIFDVTGKAVFIQKMPLMENSWEKVWA